VKGILLVAKEKIEEKHELDLLRKNYDASASLVKIETKKIQDIEDAVAKFLSDSAKRTKTSLQVIDTKDTRYLNYNKTKLHDFISDNKSSVINDDSILSSDEIVSLTKAARPEHKPAVSLPNLEVNAERFNTAHIRLSDLLKTSASNDAIERLTANGDIQNWVGEGLKIHIHHGGEVCEFCGSAFTDERKKQLEGHFNDAFMLFQQRLTAAEQWMNEQYLDVSNCSNESDLYDEIRTDYRSALEKLNASSKLINERILEWHTVVKKKISNQFDSTLHVEIISDQVIVDFNSAALTVRDLIIQHNEKTENFEKATNQSKLRLELHYAASEVKDFEYFAKIQSMADIKMKLDEAKAPLGVQLIRIQTLTNSLSDAGVGAEQFNESLHRFLGRSELSLRFKADSFGYEIIRNSSGEHDGNLSEGEKTAIAFIYFITKLTENDNRLSDTIVVVDDPVSSFDSNHLFHAYSFLRSHCKEAKQLFVLTHNFNFYKLVRDWFDGKNKGKPPTSFFYVIESNLEVPRSSAIKNANETLTKYQSEYHYLFSKLYNFRLKSTLNSEESYMTANTARKLLEAFFVFKYPKHRSDFAALLSVAQKSCPSITDDTKEKIYRFINKYSHSAVIEINHDSSENLHGESHSVISSVFDWIKEVDPIHYKEMVEVVDTV
jgi:wobble nucleotide-excising tRNase